MKANIFAAVLSLSVVSFPALAIPSTNISAPTSSSEQNVKKINLNTATAEVLAQSFKGIGKKRAEAIVTYRQNYGLFKSIADLAGVKGLGKTFVTHQLHELQKVFTVE